MFIIRLDAIACDAELQEKSQADLKRLGEQLWQTCEQAMVEYKQKLEEDPTFECELPDSEIVQCQPHDSGCLHRLFSQCHRPTKNIWSSDPEPNCRFPFVHAIVTDFVQRNAAYIFSNFSNFILVI